MVLGELPVLGRPSIWIRVGQGSLTLCSRYELFRHFSLVYLFSFLSPFLRDGPI